MTDEQLRLECVREAVKVSSVEDLVENAREIYEFVTEKQCAPETPIAYQNVTAGGTGGDK